MRPRKGSPSTFTGAGAADASEGTREGGARKVSSLDKADEVCAER